ncbi:hypothetical protein [Baekduia sp.]|uniref:hypothetical protein n=1 Tax=Baekduia sp. TaxID=2600305 RepID=UPI002E0B1A86|nr:hypothetical protein [Baekduia sp.]
MSDALPSELARRLRVNRYRQAADVCLGVLRGLGVDESQTRVLDITDTDEIWPVYLERLRAGGEARERWSAARADEVGHRVDELRSVAGSVTMVWLALVDSEPIGVEVQAQVLLDAAMSYLVSRAGDLMLATGDVADGVCVERNHLATGDEFEIVTWGRFAP